MGLALGRQVKGAGTREAGGFAKKDRITHRVEATKPSDVDGKLKRWLAVALREGQLTGRLRPLAQPATAGT